jgi:hypothetical protein
MGASLAAAADAVTITDLTHSHICGFKQHSHACLVVLLQVLAASLAAAADAGASAFIITSGPSARAGTKSSSSSGGGLFAFGGGAKGPAGADRAAQIAEKAGVGSYFVIRGAGLTATSPASVAPGLVVAEAGSVDPALAGQVREAQGLFMWVCILRF